MGLRIVWAIRSPLRNYIFYFVTDAKVLKRAPVLIVNVRFVFQVGIRYVKSF